MNLATVVTISERKFEAAKYDEIRRADILMHFLRDEIGLTPQKFAELVENGSTEVQQPPFEGTDRARFFLWYYFNYVIDEVFED
jgi:hypothetical protein